MARIHGLARPGWARHGAARRGLAWISGLARRGQAGFGMAWIMISDWQISRTTITQNGEKMKNLTVRMTGSGPMLMHSDKLSDPLNPATKAHKRLTSDRALKKTDEGVVAIAKSEYLASLYTNSDGVVCLPGLNIRKSLIEGARLHKGGKNIERGVIILDDMIPLVFDGPKTPEKLWDDPRFVDARSVVVMRSRLIRYRPVFKSWSATVNCIVNEESIDIESLMHYWREAGAMVGMGDFRPLFGRYNVEVI
jgi:hypothetical protein